MKARLIVLDDNRHDRNRIIDDRRNYLEYVRDSAGLRNRPLCRYFSVLYVP